MIELNVVPQKLNWLSPRFHLENWLFCAPVLLQLVNFFLWSLNVTRRKVRMFNFLTHPKKLMDTYLCSFHIQHNQKNLSEYLILTKKVQT